MVGIYEVQADRRMLDLRLARSRIRDVNFLPLQNVGSPIFK